VKNTAGMTVRKGSIPMVLIVVCCLGILAITSIFMTGSSARIDKKSELSQAALAIAQAAVEEIIIKASNGKAAALDGKKVTYKASVTQQISGGTQTEIAPVEVVTRVIQNPNQGNATAYEEMQELTALVPGFFKGDNAGAANVRAAMNVNGMPIKNKGANVEMWYDIEWRKKVLANAGPDYNTQFDPELVKAAEIVYVRKNGEKVMGAAFNESNLQGEALAYYNQCIKNGGNAENDNNNNPAHDKALDKFKAIATLTKIPHDQQHDTGALQAFKTQWDDAMAATAQHMQSRINGCNGDFNYAIGGMLTALGRGVPAANDSEPGEESYRDLSNDSGLTNYLEGMLTATTKVKFTQGSMSGEQSYTAHRMMRQMNLNTIMMQAGTSMIAYLHAYYNLTKKDLEFLKMATFAAGATPAPSNAMFSKMDERYSVFQGNLQIRNAQLATCLGAPR